MQSLLKAIARTLLGDYAPYVIVQNGPAPDGLALRYRIAPVTEETLRASADPLIREQVAYAGPESLAYAAYEGERIVGVCFYWYAERYRTRNFWPLAPGEAKLVQIVTASDMRGKKVAPSLIAASCEQVLAAGFKRVYARIWHSNTPSLRAFASAGWTRRAVVLEINPLRRKKPLRLRLG